MTERKLTWLAPSDGQGTRDFLRSVYDLVRSSQEPFVATAIPIGAGNLTMLHIVAGTVEGDLISFSDSIIREFETLAAETIARLSEDELAAAQQALDSR